MLRSWGRGGSGEQLVLLIQALPSLLFKFIHIIAHFSSAATGCKFYTLTFLLPTAPGAQVKGLQVEWPVHPSSEMEFIVTAFLHGAWTPWSPEDSEKLVSCPLGGQGGSRMEARGPGGASQRWVGVSPEGVV